MRSQIVSFHCVLTSQTGDLISSTFNRDVSTVGEGGPTEVLQGLAAGLKNLRKGEKRRICLSAKDAYGLYEPDLVLECPRADLKNGARLKLGDEVEAKIDGEHHTFRVIKLNGAEVTLDANHPLAGQDLIFDIDATEVRDATTEEQGSPRLGPGNSWLH